MSTPQVPQEPPIRDEDEVPTEPATSPRQIDPQVVNGQSNFNQSKVESLVLNLNQSAIQLHCDKHDGHLTPEAA